MIFISIVLPVVLDKDVLRRRLRLKHLSKVQNIYCMTTKFSNNSMKSCFQVSPSILGQMLSSNSDYACYSLFKLGHVTDRKIKILIYFEFSKNGVLRS